MRTVSLSHDNGFSGQRLLVASKEAGAGSLLAALLRGWHPAEGSVVIASPVAAPYFDGIPVRVCADDLADDEITELITSMQPERVVVGASAGSSIEKRVLSIAQAAGLPVDTFIDHYWNLWQRFADPETARPWACMPERIHVPAEACRRRLVASGYPVENIVVFDHPLLTQAKTTKRDMARGREMRAHLRIPEDAVVALFVSEYLFEPDPLWSWDQPLAADFASLLSLLLLSSARRDLGRPLYILVRPHPGESSDRWDDLCRTITGALWRNAAEVGKEALLSSADLAFGLNSMLLLEAATAGLPVYSLHFQDSPRDSWLSSIRPEIREIPDEAAYQALLESVCRVKGSIS